MPMPQKPIASPFNARSTAEAVMGKTDLSGKTVVLTGGSTGLGAETARVLAKAGASVILPVRSRDKTEITVAAIRQEIPEAKIEIADMDLGDYPSVRKFAEAFLASNRKLDLLINNAGIMATPERRVSPGYEAQFGCNHLGHFLLAGKLVPALLKAGRARVVALSSIGHRRSAMNFEDPNFTKRPYEKWTAYGQSKTANSLFAVELNRRLESQGVTAYAVHPGGIATELARDLAKEDMDALRAANASAPGASDHFKTIPEGAATTIWCAVSPLLNDGGGVYCENCNIAEAVPAETKSVSGVRPWAIDPDDGMRLWTLSEKLLEERFAF